MRTYHIQVEKPIADIWISMGEPAEDPVRMEKNFKPSEI